MIDLSIVYPAYNEEGSLPKLLNASLAVADQLNIHYEIIVVNDGSKDKTSSILNHFKETYPKKIRVIEHEKNLGYGQSLKDGFLAANGSYVFYTDADMQFDIKDLVQFYQAKQDKTIVIGYRKDRQDSPLRIFLAAGYKFLVYVFFGLRVTDIDCAFKLFPKQLFQTISIESKKFFIDAEILIKAKKLGYQFKEIGVAHFSREHGKSSIQWFHVFLTLKEMFYLKFFSR